MAKVPSEEFPRSWVSLLELPFFISAIFFPPSLNIHSVFSQTLISVYEHYWAQALFFLNTYLFSYDFLMLSSTL